MHEVEPVTAAYFPPGHAVHCAGPPEVVLLARPTAQGSHNDVSSRKYPLPHSTVGGGVGIGVGVSELTVGRNVGSGVGVGEGFGVGKGGVGRGVGRNVGSEVGEGVGAQKVAVLLRATLNKSRIVLPLRAVRWKVSSSKDP